MWYVNAIINVDFEGNATVLYKLCDMWILMDALRYAMESTVLYKLCDMWIML